MSRIIFRESATPPTGIASGQMFLFSDADGDLSWTDDNNRVVTISKVDSGAGTTTFTIPSGGGTAAALGGAQTFTGQKTFNEDIVMANGKGISFAATGQAAGMTSETLTDYEEGTWTPSYTADGNPFGPITYTANRTGVYTKVGRLVTASFVIETSSITLGSASGNIQVSGLPFLVGTTVFQTGAIAVAVGFADDRPSGILARPSTDSAFLYYRDTVDGNTINLAPADLALGATSNLMYGVVMYVV